MAKKLLYIQSPQNRRGVIIGSAWKNSKGGFGINLKGKYRKEQGGKLIDVDSYELLFKLADGSVVSLPIPCAEYEGRKQGGKMLLAPNGRKREGTKDPDMVLFAYPEQK